jgi:hypothetical protein
MSNLFVYTEQDLQRFVAPRLAAAPVEYDQRFMDQYTNILRLYFNQLDSFNSQLRTTALSPINDGSAIYFPNGCFTSTATQTAVSTTTAYDITFNNTEAADDISLVGGYQIVTAKAGRYNFQFSIQCANLDNATESIDVWFLHNGLNLPRSNTRIGMAARKNPATPFYAVGTVNTFIDMAAGDNVSLQWHTTNTLAFIQADPAAVSPTRPAIPSVIFTATFVSKI